MMAIFLGGKPLFSFAEDRYAELQTFSSRFVISKKTKT